MWFSVLCCMIRHFGRKLTFECSASTFSFFANCLIHPYVQNKICCFRLVVYKDHLSATGGGQGTVKPLNELR